MAPTSRGVTRKRTRHWVQSWLHPSRRKAGEKKKREGGNPGGRGAIYVYVSVRLSLTGDV